ALAKMRGCTDDRLIIGWVIGSRYAIVDHRAIPMLGIAPAISRKGPREDAEHRNGPVVDNCIPRPDDPADDQAVVRTATHFCQRRQTIAAIAEI
ncbi:MAG: hypothetical protein QNJ73_17300, partial [Gammaproteobacteria bacterium]|nr:hypothetical protein [Gammaproteobacteria bacterium]